jgi:hypothetical protein
VGYRRQHRRGGGRRAQLRQGSPFSDTTNPGFKASVTGLTDSVDTMILGANTYDQSKDYWPNADEQGEYGEKLNNLTKFVASSKLDDAPGGDFPAATVTRDRPRPSGSSRSRVARTSGCGGLKLTFRKRLGTSALRDQEISGKSAPSNRLARGSKRSWPSPRDADARSVVQRSSSTSPMMMPSGPRT